MGQLVQQGCKLVAQEACECLQQTQAAMRRAGKSSVGPACSRQGFSIAAQAQVQATLAVFSLAEDAPLSGRRWVFQDTTRAASCGGQGCLASVSDACGSSQERFPTACQLAGGPASGMRGLDGLGGRACTWYCCSTSFSSSRTLEKAAVSYRRMGEPRTGRSPGQGV